MCHRFVWKCLFILVDSTLNDVTHIVRLWLALHSRFRMLQRLFVWEFTLKWRHKHNPILDFWILNGVCLNPIFLFSVVSGLNDGSARLNFQFSRCVRIILFLFFNLSRPREFWGGSAGQDQHERGQEHCRQRHQVGPQWTRKLNLTANI